MTATVVMKTKDGVGELILNTPLQTGKAFIVSFLAKNGFTAEVPTVVTYKDPFDKTKVVVEFENFAQHILNSHPDLLEVVRVNVEKVVATPVIVEPKSKVEAVVEPKPKLGRPKKETQDEKDV